MCTTVLTNALTKSILAGNSPATALLLIIPNTNPNKAITTANPFKKYSFFTQIPPLHFAY